MTATYYDVPLLKPPVWTWEVPVYFFVGGAAGGAAIIGAIAELTRTDGTLARDAKRIAAAGGPLSAGLLTADLGRPERFVNMLRVLKPQSPMSVGSWTLTAFSTSSTAALVPALSTVGVAASAVTGAVMITYTGVLIGATAIPVWNRNVTLLPIHFAASGLASAAATLTLIGHDEPALNDIAIGAAAVETLIGAAIEARRDPALAPLKEGASGWATRVGGVLSGPVPLLIRAGLHACTTPNARRDRRWLAVASIAAIAGSLLTRLGWIAAGRASASDKRALRSEAHRERRADGAR